MGGNLEQAGKFSLFTDPLKEASFEQLKAYTAAGGTLRVLTNTLGQLVSIIKKVQRQTWSIELQATELFMPIAFTDPAMTVLIHTGEESDLDMGAGDECCLEIIESGTARVSRPAPGVDLVSRGSCMVIEFWKGVKSVQRGTVTILDGNLYGDCAIETVVVNKSVIFYAGQSPPFPGAGAPPKHARLRLMGQDNVRAERLVLTGDTPVNFAVVEFE